MRREPTEQRRLQIADAALKIISEQGLARFTTAAIAEEVGLTEGAIFRHFGSKEEIVLAAIDRIEQLLADDESDLGGDALERLGAIVLRRVRTARAHGVPRLVFSEDLGFAAGARGTERVAALRRKTSARIRALLEDAKAQGVLREGLDIGPTAVLVQGTIMASVLARDAGPIEQVWATLAKLLRREAPAAKPKRPRR
ncbi:MAG: TetR/AcrR family transcriptional regulator [Deltaproteobacteria bacterium]|nr:TetR/AcrR family transcriptional regulator [Deltaproteobacteria bacterium]